MKGLFPLTAANETMKIRIPNKGQPPLPRSTSTTNADEGSKQNTHTHNTKYGRIRLAHQAMDPQQKGSLSHVSL